MIGANSAPSCSKCAEVIFDADGAAERLRKRSLRKLRPYCVCAPTTSDLQTLFEREVRAASEVAKRQAVISSSRAGLTRKPMAPAFAAATARSDGAVTRDYDRLRIVSSLL